MPCMTPLPTSNPSKPNSTPYEDAAAIHKIMLPLLDEGKEVVIIAHSYGGVSSLVAIEGHTYYDAASDWGDLDFEAGLVKPNAKAGLSFYSGLNAEEVKKREKALRPHAFSAFMTPIQYSANDLECPFFYTMCENNPVVLPHQQERMVGPMKSARIEKIATGHSPMISKPDEFMKVFEKVAAAS
ncbi:hypothetical protein BDZ45DRAFT_747324 [Acephala macrosclerotiorum]|nr:hypothetical protein BDZ45DRAFT_747324 [Acephala macrosclerotiorum]